MFTSSTKIRVRYSETDQMGYVYYGNYAQYYEVGRVESMRDIGVIYAQLETQYGLIMPVISMETRFLRPGRYDELLTVKTMIPELPGRNIIFRCEIFNETGQLLNAGRIQLCFLDANTQKRVTTPEFILEKLKPYFE